MNIWGQVLKFIGWRVEISAPRREKCVICVVPHTSNWDFILGLAAYKSLGREANFLMKNFWFFFPLGVLLKRLGGIPVNRKSHTGSLTQQIIEDFRCRPYINLAVTPEGTRSANPKWKTGFLYIAIGAKVPIQLGLIDYQNKRIIIKDEIFPSGNIDEDLYKVKSYYEFTGELAKYPDKFIVS